MVTKPTGTDTHTKMRVFTLDNLYLWTQIGVVLMGLAVFVTGKLVNDRETEKSDGLNRELTEVRRGTEELRTANIAAQSALEKERLTRLELEKSWHREKPPLSPSRENLMLMG